MYCLALLLLAQPIIHCHGWFLPSPTNNARIGTGIQQRLSKKRRSSYPISLNLFSMLSNARSSNNDDDENKKKKTTSGTSNPNQETDPMDSDFPSWVEGLRQWPRYPAVMEQRSVSEDDSNNDDTTSFSSSGSGSRPREDMSVWSSRYRGSNPISNFINFEALLEAAISTTNATAALTTATSSLMSSGVTTSSSTTTTTSANPSESSTSSTTSTFPNVFAITEQLLRMSSVSAKNDDKATKRLKDEATSSLSTVSTIEEFMAFEKWMETISKTVMLGGGTSSNINKATSEAVSNAVAAATTKSGALSSSSDPTSSSPVTAFSAENIVKEATARIEYLVNASSVALSPSRFQNMILQANRALSWTSVETATDKVLQAAGEAAQDRGLDVKQVKDRARETTRFAADIVSVANSLFGAGFAYGAEPQDASAASISDIATGMVDSSSPAPSPEVKPLFADFASARVLTPSFYRPVVAKAAEMGPLAGTIYEVGVDRVQQLGHALVANGTTADVYWMITDSIGYESDYVESSSSAQPNNGAAGQPILIRTITIRGFDASDETVDRERLLNTICRAQGVPLSNETTTANPSSKVVFHKGLLSTARAIYKDVKKYVDWASSSQHRIVLNGHSIGGSLSILLLFLLTEDLGAETVRKRVLRAFALGSPPIAAITEPLLGATKTGLTRSSKSMDSPLCDDDYRCDILEAFGLPSSMVYGYVQPWDPIVRFLTEYDALYPLVDDLGDDGITLYSTGPPRSLRPITRAIFQSWDGWPQFRDSWKGTNQKYRSVGIQHLLLPEPLRYLNDRFVSTNIGVPDTDSILRISSRELLPALEATFPMDVFQISFVPQAVRSFLHHFYPAYDFTLSGYAQKLLKRTEEARVSSEKTKSKKIPTTFPVPKPGIIAVDGMRNKTTAGTSSRGWAVRP